MRVFQGVLESFQSIENDRAVAGAVDELPHTAGDRPLPSHQMRETLAGVRPGFVNRAEIAIQEDAAVLLTAPQDPAFVLAHNRIIAAKFGNRGAQEARESLDIAVGNGDGGGLAAVGAVGAIDLRLD